jgi:hypothetical protein
VYGLMGTLVDRLDRSSERYASVIPWSCPVPFFGGLLSAVVGTVGINPSQREFVDARGSELEGNDRRLPTLGSLALDRWRHADATHLRDIASACSSYFGRNPYDRWFGVLERILAPAGFTLYGSAPTACHLDLVPFATCCRWTALSSFERRDLLFTCGDYFARLLELSGVRTLVLNGQSVVGQFQLLAGLQLEVRKVTGWSLHRSGSGPVVGLCYSGEVETIGSVTLARPVRVLGFNHNLQSSFGVSGNVVDDIGQWIARDTGE